MTRHSMPAGMAVPRLEPARSAPMFTFGTGHVAGTGDVNRPWTRMELLEDVGPLRDRDLWLELRAREPANEQRGLVPAYRFAMHLDGVNQPVGRLGLRIGSNHTIEHYAGHIGYEVAPGFRGNRLAERSCRLVLPLARRHGFEALWITCNPDNWASRRTCERLGARFVEIVDVPRDSDLFVTGSERKCRYHLPL